MAIEPERILLATAGPCRIELGKHVVDKGLLDRDNMRCGKVDDLVLEVCDAQPGRPPRVAALVTGPTAFARTAGAPLLAAARLIYRLFGITDPRPVEVAWAHIRQIDALVRLDIPGDPIKALPNAVRDRLMRRLPGS